MKKKIIEAILFLTFVGTMLPGCVEKKQDVVILTKSFKKERSVNTAVPDEFSSFAPASQGINVWVEGKVKNEGTTDLNNVELSFKCKQGVETRVLTAVVKWLPAGKTVDYKTRLFASKIDVSLMNEEPEIHYEE